MSNLDAILNQYEKSTAQNTNSGGKTFNLNNYFTTFLQKGVNTATRTIRLLPSATEGESPFIEMYGHNYQLADGSWKTFACLKHENDEDCPFCDTRAGLLADGTEDAKEAAKKFRPRKFYICKVIDRENEDHGVKFWRFRDNWQKQGTLDKIVNVMKLVEGDMSDATAEHGQDLVIDIARNSNQVPIVQSILPANGKSRLSEDAALEKEWLDDKSVWKEVYSVKPYAYLEIVIKGGIPTYDKVNECWVDKDTLEADTTKAPSTSESLDSELAVGNANTGLVAETTTPVAETPVKTEAIAEVPASEPELATATTTTTTDDEDDDMPF